MLIGLQIIQYIEAMFDYIQESCVLNFNSPVVSSNKMIQLPTKIVLNKPRRPSELKRNA